MPGTVLNTLHTLSCLLIRATHRSRHQYLPFLGEETSLELSNLSSVTHKEAGEWNSASGPFQLDVTAMSFLSNPANK